MIKFFRKIRQKLWIENKFNKYLIYAFGEIVLVVIGILIALQINSWNQNRLDRITETKYLNSIVKELKLNGQFNKSLVTNRFSKKVEGLNLAKKYCENELLVIDTLEFLNSVSYGGVFSGGYDFGARNSYDELINTGNLQLIRKDTLKSSIAQYYAYISSISERTIVHSSGFSNYTSELRPFNSENPTYFSKFDQLEMMESFKSIEFRKRVDLELSYAFKIRDYLKNINSLSEQTINLIEKEIKDGLEIKNK
tara:strand:+ start:20745 stop:21500 length:756 start_codon:yes stop_codon:yes gene_type:complete